VVKLWYSRWSNILTGDPEGFLLTTSVDFHEKYKYACHEWLVAPNTGPIPVTVERLPYRAVRDLSEQGCYRSRDSKLQEEIDSITKGC